jgi:hypothetical protein
MLPLSKSSTLRRRARRCCSARIATAPLRRFARRRVEEPPILSGENPDDATSATAALEQSRIPAGGNDGYALLRTPGARPQRWGRRYRRPARETSLARSMLPHHARERKSYRVLWRCRSLRSGSAFNAQKDVRRAHADAECRRRHFRADRVPAKLNVTVFVALSNLRLRRPCQRYWGSVQVTRQKNASRASRVHTSVTLLGVWCVECAIARGTSARASAFVKTPDVGAGALGGGAGGGVGAGGGTITIE